MKVLGKYCRVILALLMLAAAAYIYARLYQPAREEFERRRNELSAQLAAEQMSCARNLMYAGVRDQLSQAEAELAESRARLYENFPKELREEDQILYILELEERFGTEITFSFGDAAPVAGGQLSDGAVIEGVELKVNYETTYQGFKDMLNFLSTDARITSIREAEMRYDPETDTLTGTVTILRYLIDSAEREYTEPEIEAPDGVGKSNIFERGDAEDGEEAA